VKGAGVGAGLALLAALWGVALAAPLLAGERPLLQRTAGRTYFPALAGLPGVGALVRTAAPAPGAGDLVILPPLPHDPAATDLSRSRRPPGAGHPLGTDDLGRDLAARLVHGARTSLFVGGAGTVGALGIGLLLGALAGYRGGRVDQALSAVIDVALCFPSLVLAMAAVAVTGARGPWALAAVLALTRWGRIARYARGEFARLRGSNLAGAARAAGASDLRVLGAHLLPNALAPVLVTAAFSAAGAVLLEGALGFLGLGVAPPRPSWGGSLADGWAAGGRAWWLTVFPGLAIFLVLAGYGLLGEGLLDRLDPRREAARSGGTPARSNAL
jgi:peptide/nickel transport system permease protein